MPNLLKKKISPYVAGIVVFFFIIFTINIYFFYLAYSGYAGVIDEDHYEKGLAYEKTLEVLRHSKQLGWKVDRNYGPIDKEGFRDVVVQLVSSEGQPVSGAKVSLEIKRPSDAYYDISAEAAEMLLGSGNYQAQVRLPLSGLWLLELRAKKGEDNFLWKGREMLP